MSILVTGATGFIGSYVVEELLCRGEKVITTSRSQNGAKRATWFGKTEHIVFDIKNVTDENLSIYFSSPDTIIHLAWGDLDNYNSSKHIEDHLSNHYKFIKNLVQSGVSNIVVSGTCFEYGLSEGCLSEGQLANPGTSYGLAKDSLHRFLVDLQKKNSFNLKWLRYFYMYGKGQNPKSLLPLLESAIERGDNEFKMSGGEQLRDYLPVEKVAEKTVATSLSTSISGTINICSGKPVSVRNIIEQRVRELGSTIKLILGYYPYPSHEPMAFWGDNKKFLRVIDND